MARVFSLTCETPAVWAERALEDVPGLLADHRACELKAAAMAVSLARRWADALPALGPAMRGLEREELAHARLVERLQRERGHAQAGLGANEYSRKLRRLHSLRGGGLTELLLVCALIEARSCERFMLLAKAGAGTPLAGFYEDFIAAEARHHAMFVELAAESSSEGQARAALRALSEEEGKILASLPAGPRMHSGVEL